MRVPIVLQRDTTDCGPAVLAMIAAYYGKRMSIARLREIAGTDRRGTTMAGLMAAAEQAGFHARAIRATMESLCRIELPAVAHWQENGRNHFVVLCRVKPAFVILADPARGRRRIPAGEFRQCWTGALLLLRDKPELRTVVTTRSSFSRLCALLLPHRHLFLDVLLAAVLMTILGLASSFYIQALVDFVFVLGRKPALNWLGLGMLLVLVARAAFLALRTYLLAHLSQRIDADTILSYHRHLLGLPLAFFSTRRTGEILSRLTDAVKIRIAISATTLSVAVDSLLAIATIAIMLAMNWRVTLLSVCLLPIVGGAVWVLNNALKGHQRRAMEKAAEIEAQLVETIGGIHTVKAMRAEPSVQLRLEARFAEMTAATFRTQMLASHNATFTSLATGVSGLVLLWLGAGEVLGSRMSVGELMALNTMFGMFLGPLERLSGANQSIQDALVAADRLGEVMELEPEKSRQRSRCIDRTMHGTVEFRNVTFRYGARAPVLKGISLRIEAGECIGLIGESGSGKTTLVNLLGRFYDPVDGQIAVDGVDIRDYAIDCLRREIGFVPQDVVLFSGSISENILLGRPTATLSEIHAAGRLARVEDFASRLASGYDTLVGERGFSLSGGERQRVALARVILKDPSILVLDEPTNHLDGETETAVQSLIDSRRGSRTTIVITHRPLQFDRMIDLDELRYRLDPAPH